MQASHVDPRGPVAAVVLAAVVTCYTLVSAPAKAGASFPWTVNPTGLLNDVTTLVGLYAATIPAKAGFWQVVN